MSCCCKLSVPRAPYIFRARGLRIADTAFLRLYQC